MNINIITYIILFISFIFTSIPTISQDRYVVEFVDKAHNQYDISNPSTYLSLKSIQRRLNQNVIIDSSDLPVSQSYIDTLSNYGCVVQAKSKWFNSVVVEVLDTLLFQQALGLPFVKQYKKVYEDAPVAKNLIDKYLSNLYTSNESSYQLSLQQISQLNGDFLHAQNLNGENRLIAVIDGGFSGVDTFSLFENMRNQNQIIGSYDFIHQSTDVYHSSTHGTSVFSIIALKHEQEFQGTAPNANFLLLLSEASSYEQLVEEEYLISALEYADSIGVDVVNISLGYHQFDVPNQNHQFSELDGATVRASRAINFAAQKGIIPVVSAGNQGNKDWKKITVPADAIYSLTVGAVDRANNVAGFSSRGYNAAGMVKPNVMAIGQSTATVNNLGTISVGNGTSFSAPIITGLAACLWQAFPQATNFQVMNAIQQSAHLYNNPNVDYGYGIPNFKMAHNLLSAIYDNDFSNQNILVYPNPTHDCFMLYLKDLIDQPCRLNIYNQRGDLCFSQSYEFDHVLNLNVWVCPFSELALGVYFGKLYLPNQVIAFKIVKID